MIVYLQRHIAAFTGQVTYMAVPGIAQQIVCIPAAAPAVGQPFYIRDSYTMPDFLGNQQS